MLTVDNNAKGNCMYYAYGISLMYYLRAKNDNTTTEDIFNKLKLKDDQKISLRAVLSRDLHEPFSKHEIDTIIEPILGRATRDLAGDRTVDEFHIDPYATPFFTAAKYGLEHCFKQSLQSNGSELANLIDHHFTDPNYTNAEIYRVAGMKSGMQEFSKTRLAAIIEELNKQWTIKQEEFKGITLSESDVQFHKSNLLDNIIRKETVDFFSENSCKYLNAYKKHLQTEYVWGAEETLMTLHRGIQGERMDRNEKGTIDTFYDTEIVLHLQVNGRSPFFQSGSPVMILNNSSNVHWTSKIPDSIFSPNPRVTPPKEKTQEKKDEVSLGNTSAEPSPSKAEESVSIHVQKMLKILDDMKVARDNIPKAHKEFGLAKNLIEELETQISIIAHSQELKNKEIAVDKILNLIFSATPQLGRYQSWGTLFKNFLSSLLDCIPSFLGGKKIRSGLARLGMYNDEGRRTEITRAIERVSNKLLDAVSEQTTSIEGHKKSTEDVLENYPSSSDSLSNML